MAHATRNNPTSTPKVVRPRRRMKPQAAGVAMLLVLVCLATATVATTAYVSSRDNSGLIGDNVAEAATARWAAASGLDLTLAAMESGWDWRTLHSSGKLVDSYTLGKAILDIELSDVETQAAPGPLTTHVDIHVTATVGNLQQVAKGRATVPNTPLLAEVDLSEFVVFARERIEVEDTARIARWDRTPLGRSGRRLAIGTLATDSSSIEISSGTVPIDCEIYHRNDADSLLVRNQSLRTVRAVSMYDPIPVPAPPYCGVEEPEPDSEGVLSWLINTVVNTLTATTTILVDTVAKAVDLNSGSSVITVRDATLVVEDDLRLRSGAGMIIEGDVKIVVFGNVDLGSNTYIELRPNSRLRMFVRGDVGVNMAYIGTSRPSNTRNVTGGSPWRANERVVLYTIDEGGSPTWRFRGDSEIRASVYAPNARVRVENSSAVYGRIAADDFRLRNSASVYYDPTMDRRVGYTNQRSALFNDDRIRSAVVALPSLDPDELEALASSLGVRILAEGEPYGSAAAAEDTEVLITFDVSAFGTDVSGWEDSAQ